MRDDDGEILWINEQTGESVSDESIYGGCGKERRRVEDKHTPHRGEFFSVWKINAMTGGV